MRKIENNFKNPNYVNGITAFVYNGTHRLKAKGWKKKILCRLMKRELK